MIRALVTGRLLADPQPRTASSGQPFALARLSVKQDDGWVSCSTIAFDAAAARLLELKAGTAVSVAGSLAAKVWTADDGTAHPTLDLIADEVASVVPRSRRGRRDRSTAADGSQGEQP